MKMSTLRLSTLAAALAIAGAAHAESTAKHPPAKSPAKAAARPSTKTLGAAPDRVHQLPPAEVTAINNDYRLGPGDGIKVQVYQNPDMTVETRVSESGVVNYPLAGRLNLGGLTIAEAENRVAKALKQKQILRAPHVNITLVTIRGNQVAVLGQVQKPGRFPLETTTLRVSDMLALAGGVTPTGDDRVVVTGIRNKQPYRREVDLNALFGGQQGTSEDILLRPGDTLYVAKAPTFYIYGEAQKPGGYRVERNMTVMQALAAGGGITSRGSQNRLDLTRTNPDGTVVQMSPRLTDPVRPGDVLFVKESIF